MAQIRHISKKKNPIRHIYDKSQQIAKNTEGRILFFFLL
jgi:hypothetical protein